MERLYSRIKIKDIAEKAGVSSGTVDRVLHNRGNVSVESRRKVMEVLKASNYTPNLYASALASKKSFVFVAVIPSHEAEDYWERVEQGIWQGAKELSDFRVKINVVYFSLYDTESFCAAMDSVLQDEPDGVIFAPTLKSVTLRYCIRMDNMKIPYTFVDSYVEGSNPLAYYGQDSYRSGQLAARLLLMQKSEIREVAVFTFYHAGQEASNQTSLRSDGFCDRILEDNPQRQIYKVTLQVDSMEENERIMDHLFLENPQITGAVINSSRSYVVAEYLDRHQLSGKITLIGYDLLDRNVACLKNGSVSFLLAQRPQFQSYNAIRALSDTLIFKKQVEPVNYMPIDILTAENVDYY